MEESTKLILLGASITVVCLVVAIIFQVYRTSSSSATDLNNQILQTAGDMAQSDITKYDGLEVTGNDVLNAVRRYQDEVMVVVILNNGIRRTFTGGDVVNTLGSANYISPIGDFVGKVVRDVNGVIQSLEFEEV